MTEVNWTKLYSLHKGKWVALKDDEKTVIASGLHARTVLEKAQKAGYKNPIMTKIPKKQVSYIG